MSCSASTKVWRGTRFYSHDGRVPFGRRLMCDMCDILPSPSSTPSVVRRVNSDARGDVFAVCALLDTRFRSAMYGRTEGSSENTESGLNEPARLRTRYGGASGWESCDRGAAPHKLSSCFAPLHAASPLVQIKLPCHLPFPLPAHRGPIIGKIPQGGQYIVHVSLFARQSFAVRTRYSAQLSDSRI